MPLAADFRVDESGAATLTVPLDLPVARGEIQPELSFNYSSRNQQDGLLGLGWSLGGVQSIHRCAKSPFFDGEIGNVSLTANDRFCLNGQRLHVVSGSYGASGALYRIDGQPSVVVSSHGGNVNTGPRYFKLVNQANETMYFGNVEAVSPMSIAHNAYYEPGQAGTVSAWYIAVVEDVVGNYISYHYDNDLLVGDVALTSIRYAGNRHTEAAPYIQIELSYQRKAYPRNGYVAGYPHLASKQLEAVTVYIDDEIIRRYQLSYNEPQYSHHHLVLYNIAACATGVNGLEQCTPALDLNWSLNYDDYTSPNFELFDASELLYFNTPDAAENTRTFDINGDGLDDLIYLQATNPLDSNSMAWHYRLAPYFNQEHYLTNRSALSPEKALVIDSDGDGARELLVADNANSHWFVHGHTTSRYLGRTALGYDHSARVMDVDGDASEDIVFMQSNTLYVYLNDGAGVFSSAQQLLDINIEGAKFSLNSGTHSQVAGMSLSSALDINGDGRSDLLLPIETTQEQCVVNGVIVPKVRGEANCLDLGGEYSVAYYRYLDVYVADNTASGELTFTQLHRFPSYDNDVRIADFNGDGLSDIAYPYADIWHIRMSNGIELLPHLHTGISVGDATARAQTLFMDVNSDGRTDLLRAGELSRWAVFLAQVSHDGIAVHLGYRDFIERPDTLPILAGRFTQDTRIDVLVAENNRWQLHSKAKDTVTQVLRGYRTSFGGETTIEYAPMVDESIYDDRLALPTNSDLVAARGPWPLVARVSTATSALDEVSVTYRYGGQAVHKQGLGSLGFAWLETQDEQSGVITRTDYFQSIDATDYVLNGMPTSTEQTLNGQLLSRATNELATRSTADGGVMGYIATATEYGYQYTSAGQSVLRTTTQTTTLYDDYGNVTELSVLELDQSTGVSKTTQTSSTYGDQRFGRLTHTVVTRTRSDDATVFNRESSFAYRSDGLLVESVVAPNDADYKLTTQYVYDDYGQKVATHVSGVAQTGGTLQTRSSYVVYDSRGRYVHYKENHWGYRTTYQYNDMPASSATGRTFKITETNTNGESAQQWFDAFGR